MFAFRSTKSKPKPIPTTPRDSAMTVSDPGPRTPLQNAYSSHQMASYPVPHGWQCSVCTFENEIGAVICGMCLAESPKVNQHLVNGNRGDNLLTSPSHETARPHNSPQKLTVELAKHLSEDVTMQSVVFFADGTSVENILNVKSEDLLGLLTTQTKSADGISNAKSPLQTDSSRTAMDSRYDSRLGLLGAPNVYKESTANAGLAGGERVISPSVDGKVQDNSKMGGTIPDRSASKVDKTRKYGAPQIPLHEEISIQERNAQLTDGGGARVNQRSGMRLYDLGNYERSVFIDPTRHTNMQSRERVPKAASAETTGVPLEVASVAAKIRNISKVGGERVKEMDHFVASVETPVVKLVLNEGQESALKATDVGAYVQAAVKADKMKSSDAVVVQGVAPDGRSVAYSLLVEGQYLMTPGPLGSAPVCPRNILRYCQLFLELILHVFDILRIDASERTVQLYYMTTMRADELVCSVAAPPDGRLYLNALVFQQADCFEMDPSDSDIPLRVVPSRLREQLSGWASRVAIALQKAAAAIPGRPAAPPGLYDKATRVRFYDTLLRLTPPAALQPADLGVALMSSSARNVAAVEAALESAMSDATFVHDQALKKKAHERLCMLRGVPSSVVADASRTLPSDKAGPEGDGALFWTPPAAPLTPIGRSAVKKPINARPIPTASSSSAAFAEAPGARHDATEVAVSQLLDLFSGSGWRREELLSVYNSNGCNLDVTIDTIFNLGSPEMLRG